MSKMILTAFVFSFLMAGCEEGPYLKHEVELKKLGGICSASNKDAEIKMISNTNGERYTFQECLPDGFKKEQLSVERKGDTVLVRYDKAAAGGSRYEVVLDVNTWPRYRYITIGDNTLTIIPAGN